MDAKITAYEEGLVVKAFAAMLVTLFATASVASAQTAVTLTGKIVDAATYVTSDHNMDSMTMKEHGSTSMSGSMSSSHAMGNAMKEECGILGLLSQGKLTLLASQMGSQTSATVCNALGKTVTLSGKTYTRAGLTVFLVGSLK
jgi:predicted porin